MEAPGKSRLTIEQFCGKVCAYVRFRPDHAAITAELTAHLEDHASALEEHGVPADEAAAWAVAAMGDPEEVGRALNKSHSPLLGWFQIWFGRAVWSLAALVLLVNLPQTVSMVSGLTAPLSYGLGMLSLLKDYDERDVVSDFTPTATWQYQGYTFSVPRAVVTRSSDGSLTLFYTMKASHSNPWLRDPEFWEWLWAEDDLGNSYLSYGQVIPYQSSAVLSSGGLSMSYFFGPGRMIAALDRRNEYYRHDRYYILQDGDWYAWCGVSRIPGQPFWNPGILLAVENDPELPLVPLVVDGWRGGLILVISNDPEIARVEVRFPASDEDSPGLSLFSVSQTQKAENCFLVSYSTSDLYAHYPEDLQVMGYDSSGELLYQSPAPETWATRYELR